MTDVRAVQIVHFPSPTSTEAARRLRSLISGGQTSATVTGIDADPRPPSSAHLVLVLPILGDDRIPPLVEGWIARAEPRSTYAVCVTGDLRSGQTTSRVADEADRLLGTKGGSALAQPLLMDAPVDWDANLPRMSAWLDEQRGDHRSSVHPAGPARSEPVPPPSEPASGDQPMEPALRRLIDLLGAVPQVALDAGGLCRKLSLVDSANYPRSLLSGARAGRVAEILTAVHELEALEVLGLPFADLRELPFALPSRLAGLDLRGNPFASWAWLPDMPGLVALNLAGCDLQTVPDAVTELDRLRALVLAKNLISDVGAGMARLQRLELLTVYRNRLSQFPEAVTTLHRLRLLNVGANPVPELPPSLRQLQALEVLGLRLLQLVQLPAFLAEMPSLRYLDCSKTAAVPPVELVDSGIALSTDGMPSWSWDDVVTDATVDG